MSEEAEIEKARVFHPFAMEELLQAMEAQQRFAHYTSASVAMSIIQRREIWMRNVSCMNDYAEVTHGLECIHDAWHSDRGKKLTELLENKFPGMVERATFLFDGWQQDMKFNTYITCVSKHHDDEDEIGRLSMWRAYGGNAGIAIVLRGTPFFRTENTINVFSTPVKYLGKNDFQSYFYSMMESIISDKKIVPKMNTDELSNRILNSLYFSALASKHPGFREEEEWRAIYAPKYFGADIDSRKRLFMSYGYGSST